MGIFNKKQAESPAHPSASSPVATLTLPLVRQMVLAATTTGNYGAVQDLFSTCRGRVPGTGTLWYWWADGVETLAATGDPDWRSYAQFVRDAGYIDPWGDLPPGVDDRLRALTG